MIKKEFSLTKHRNLLSIFVALLIFGIVFSFSATNFLYNFDKKIQNIYFLIESNKLLNVNKNLIVVEIDDDTLSGRKDINGNITTEGLGRFPFDRKYYSTVIDNLNDAGVAIIALDIIFGEKSGDTEKQKESDRILANSIEKAGNVILGLWPNSAGVIQYPYEMFGKHILHSGYLAPEIDKTTNVVYSIRPFAKFKGSDKILDHFAIAVIKGFYSKIYNDEDILTSKVLSYPTKLLVGDRIELIRSRPYKNEVLINYTNRSKFTNRSFLDIYNNQFDKALFKDKIVVVGATAKGIKDVFNTPLGIEFGVYSHVNLINTVLSNRGIKYFNQNIEWLLIFLFTIVSVYFNISKSSYVLVLSNLSLVAIFLLLVLYITVMTNTLLNYVIELFLCLVLSIAISNILKYLIENKNKAKLNKALSEYVSADVANEILSGEGRINLDGEDKEVAIFFSDIEGFTSISEKFSAEQLVSFLREYLSKMSDIIMDEKGFINKYEGDAIMALWGVFGDDGAETYRICVAALHQQKVLNDLNVEWKKKGFSIIKTRIGIHHGNAIIGNIGSEGRKMEFTALGDNVNLASRLEGVNKYYGTYVCASENIYEKEKESFEFRYLDIIRVKGKENPVKIYELISMKGDLTKDQEHVLFNFKVAINLYKEMKFSEALPVFTRLADKWDGPSITYKERCEEYIKNPPDVKWDGVWTMTSK